MSYDYNVTYAFEAKEENSDEKTRHGFGKIEVFLDSPPDTDEKLKEIARFIGKKNDYKSVGIVQIVAAEDDNDTLQGEIVE